LANSRELLNFFLIEMLKEKKHMKKGDKVHWKWGKSEAEGTVVEKTEKSVEKKLKGTVVKRKASKAEPAYVIKQANGTEVIKSESEIEKGAKKK